MSNYELSTKKALERIFVYQAVEYGFLTQEQLKECIEEQERQSTDENQIDLLTICKQKKYLTASQCNHLMSKRLDASVARALGESLNQKEEKKPSVESQIQEIVQEKTQQFRAIAREEREELERRMNEKERVLDRERKQAEFYRRKQEALEKKLENFEEEKQLALQEKQNHIEKLENELNNLQRILTEQNQNFSQFNTVLQDKDASLERERQKNQALFKLLEGTNQEIQEATEEKMKWEAECERISKELNFKLTQELQEKTSLKQNIEELENKIQEAETKAKEAENKYQVEEQKLHEAENKCHDETNKIHEIESKIQEAENKVQESENKVQELNSKLQDSENKLQEFTSKNEELSKELEKIRTINQNLEQKVADYTIQHANQEELVKKNLAQTQSFEAFKREKEDFLKQILQEKQQLERDIVSINSEKQKLEQNIQNINSEKQKLEQNIQNINSEKQKLEQNIQNISAEKQELEQNIQNITAEKKQQEQLFEQQKTAQEATFHSEKIALESELSQYKQKNENLEAKLQKFQASLGNWDEVERQKNQYKQILEQEQKKQKLLLKEKEELEERLHIAENQMHRFNQIPVDGSNLEAGTLLPGSNGESYVIQGMIGRGGMGIAYSAIRQSDENIVVVKTLLPEHMGDMKVIIRFVQEARTILSFDHENLVHGYDIYQGSTLSFFVMEYLDGPSVEDILEEQPMIEPLRATEIVLGIARALEYLEKNSLVHRDVKPANIIITKNGTPKLVDFGIVKMTDRNCSLTTDGIILGTPYYLSPEQTYQTNVDIRSDIYSLGATFFHMVVGEVPFPGDNPIDVIQKRLTKTPKPEKIKSDLPKPICAVIERMMNRNVKKRYDTVTDLVHELEGIIKILKR